ncbi:DUF2336 domain-containing protein [Cucumibacter marinus]|uniref:DUF2336 domain-containing protein n=1 Tax=Cucumibacter marinus TaxID=1121252 RepID=UPI000410D340|nr:DUF2336 domain-containing protein [Cucumibacter marinus]
MMDDQGTGRAFENFRALSGTPNIGECDVLIRNMAQLFSHVSDRCDDEQVAQYDEVLCQLADLVEEEARAHVADLLSRLERAPGTVVVRLANDSIEVARPLLEFSNVLSDDDLIDVVKERSEEHRVAVAGRNGVTDRVGDAIVTHGGQASVLRLVNNSNAELGEKTLPKLVERASKDPAIAGDMRMRRDVDWQALGNRISQAGQQARSRMPGNPGQPQADNTMLGKAQAVVYNRIKNRIGFDAGEWRIAWNQVKALNDRKRLDLRAMDRFARFGYGHHTAAGLTVMLNVKPEVVVRWLATQDYVALTVASRALGLDPVLFENVVAVMPWRDMPTKEDRENVRKRFEALSADEARNIFDLWRAHSFRRRPEPGQQAVGAA